MKRNASLNSGLQRRITHSNVLYNTVTTKDSKLKEAVESILNVDMAGKTFLMKNQMYKNLQRKYAAQTTSEGRINVERMTFLLFQKIQFAKGFCKWLTSMTGGSRPENQADQIVSRALKFLKSVSSDDLSFEEVTDGIGIDFYLGSGRDISDFIENLESKTGVGHSGQLGYINALCDLIDYRKYQGVTSQVLQKFSVVEMLLRKARKCVSKEMRIQWNSQLDIESLEKRGHWATLENLQDVIPFHLEHYKTTLESCQENPRSLTSKDLTFATRFIAVYLFLNVKGTRPMTYQFLMVEMFQDAKQCNGFVDQNKFKTADSYSFDSFKLDSTSIKVVDQYVKHIRQLIGPKWNHLLLNRNGMQFSKLTDCMGKLVFEAIGKYIHPIRYRQIIETESSQLLMTD